ncbi:MAG TPA: hypothetical protein VHW72_05685 [Candidatus Angelobacter sp.]|jgi:hypothetical protein|nr:hypothetical protein [Candidatus Angelobacter sp.]
MSQTLVRVTPQDFAPPAVIDRMRSRSLVVGAVFSVVALGLTLGTSQWDLFLRSWLFSFMFWLGLTLGSLVLLMLQYTSGGNWGRLGRRIWEAGAGNWWLMGLFWLPIAIGMKRLYVWARIWDDPSKSAQLLAHYGADKIHYYLNVPGFWVRGVLYFAGWGILYYFLKRWSVREEAGTTTPSQFVFIQNLSGFGIVFYGLTITFASIDWTMSLYPEWWSTVWGMLFMVGQVLTTFCFTIWLFTRLSEIEPISRIFKVDYLHDFGKLMFAFVVLWAYLSFSQWLIIWSGNMLSEIRWYLMRLQNGWQYFGTILIFVHFVFPFALLLSRNNKRSRKRIVAISFLVLFMRLVDLFWQTAPNFYPGTNAGLNNFHLLDAAMYVICPIAMGGIWLFFFYLRLSKRSLMPVNDPGFVQMLEAKHG